MKKLVLIISFLSLPYSAFAQEAFYVGGLLGLTSIDATFDDGTKETYDSELSYGLRAGVLFNDHLAAGLFLHQYGHDTTSSPANVELEYEFRNIMAELTYFFSEADENSFWVSGLLGVTQSSLETSIPSSNEESDTSYGASIGYNFMVAPNFSISPQFTYIYTDSNLVNYNQFSGLVNLTFWL